MLFEFSWDNVQTVGIFFSQWKTPWVNMIHLNSNHGEWKVNPAVGKKASSIKHWALCIFDIWVLMCSSFIKGCFHSWMPTCQRLYCIYLFPVFSSFHSPPPLLIWTSNEKLTHSLCHPLKCLKTATIQPWLALGYGFMAFGWSFCSTSVLFLSL